MKSKISSFIHVLNMSGINFWELISLLYLVQIYSILYSFFLENNNNAIKDFDVITLIFAAIVFSLCVITNKKIKIGIQKNIEDKEYRKDVIYRFREICSELKACKIVTDNKNVADKIEALLSYEKVIIDASKKDDLKLFKNILFQIKKILQTQTVLSEINKNLYKVPQIN